MKKIIALLLAAIMVLGLAACASKTETKEASDVKNVVYIVNGNLGDKSFFDSAQAGIDELVKAGRITCKTIELGGTDEDQPKWLSTLYDVSESGEYDLVICGTYQMPDYLKEVATKYPDQLYLIFDDNTYAGENSNVVNITYKQNDMGYLVGTFAACMTTDTSVANINEDAVVGFEKKFKINRQFLDSLAENDIMQYNFSAFADSMLIMHGTRDETVPIDAVRRFAEKNDLMLIEINGADHMFKDPARMSEYVNDTVDFIFS